MRKYFLGWTLLLAVFFIGAGTFMAMQGFQAQADVKTSVAAEEITLGKADKPDGTRDEVVAEFVPAEYQGMGLADVGKPEALLWQRDVIRGHTLARTDGLVFAKMPRVIPKVDEAGNPVLDEDGKPVMVPNVARDMWTQSTALQSALLQGYMAWKLSELIIGLGAAFIFMGIAALGLGLPLARRK